MCVQCLLASCHHLLLCNLSVIYCGLLSSNILLCLIIAIYTVFWLYIRVVCPFTLTPSHPHRLPTNKDRPIPHRLRHRNLPHLLHHSLLLLLTPPPVHLAPIHSRCRLGSSGHYMRRPHNMCVLHRNIPIWSKHRVFDNVVRTCRNRHSFLPRAHLRARRRGGGGRSHSGRSLVVDPEVVLHARNIDSREFHDLLGNRLLYGAGYDGVLSAAVCRAPVEVRALLVLLVRDSTVCGVRSGGVHCPGRADWEKV